MPTLLSLSKGGQHGAAKLDALAGEDLALPVQGQVVAVFVDQNMGQQRGRSHAPFDGQRRHRFLNHGLTNPAAERRAHVPDHPEAARDIIQDLGHVTAHFAHLPTAVGTDGVRLMSLIRARQVLRQLAPGLAQLLVAALSPGRDIAARLPGPVRFRRFPLCQQR